MPQTGSRKILLFCAVLASLYFALPHTPAAWSAAPKKVATTINSSNMEYDANAQVVRFTGAVHVQRPDFELWADAMTVYLDATGQATGGAELSADMQAGDIDRIVAQGKVRMKNDDKTGTCDKATYYAKEDRFVMEGSPMLVDGKQSRVTGETITHYFNSNRSHVGRDAGVTFYAPDKTENGKKSGPAMEGLKP